MKPFSENQSEIFKNDIFFRGNTKRIRSVNWFQKFEKKEQHRVWIFRETDFFFTNWFHEISQVQSQKLCESKLQQFCDGGWEYIFVLMTPSTNVTQAKVSIFSWNQFTWFIIIERVYTTKYCESYKTYQTICIYTISNWFFRSGVLYYGCCWNQYSSVNKEVAMIDTATMKHFLNWILRNFHFCTQICLVYTCKNVSYSNPNLRSPILKRFGRKIWILQMIKICFMYLGRYLFSCASTKKHSTYWLLPSPR